jgi:hypothetical protein
MKRAGKAKMFRRRNFRLVYYPLDGLPADRCVLCSINHYLARGIQDQTNSLNLRFLALIHFLNFVSFISQGTSLSPMLRDFGVLALHAMRNRKN